MQNKQSKCLKFVFPLAHLSRSQPPSESVPPFELWLPASCFLADSASKTESQARVLWISSAFKHSSWPKQLCLYRIFVWHFVLHLSDRDWWMELDVIVSMCGYWCSSKQPEPRQNVQIYVGASYVVCFALAHFQPQSPRFQCATAGELAPSGNDRKKSKLGWLGYARLISFIFVLCFFMFLLCFGFSCIFYCFIFFPKAFWILRKMKCRC